MGWGGVGVLGVFDCWGGGCRLCVRAERRV